MWQANFVSAELTKAGFEPEIKIIKTQGDRIQHLSFDKMEGKGFFTKEIEAALLANEIDIAVHSHKDLETTNPPGLTIAAVSERANPHDLLLIRKEAYNPTANFYLKADAIIGTSAARRIAQLHRHFNPEQVKMLRGNVPTRIQKLRDGNYDAILLAAAGVERLEIDLSDLEVIELRQELFVSAPAQGFLAIQCRENDPNQAAIAEALDHQKSREIIALERGILKALHGGCQVPLGAFAKWDGEKYRLWLAHAKASTDVADQSYMEGADADKLLADALAWIAAEKKK